jgi:hypothetical protein
MSPRFRRRLIGATAVFGVAAVVASVVTYYVSHLPPPNVSLSVIAVESAGGPAATIEADLAAELSAVEPRGGQLFLTAIADQTAAPALDVSLNCPSGDDPISCNQLSQSKTVQAEMVADQLAAAPRPDHVDLYALFSQISEYVAELPPNRNRVVEVFVNTLGDADIPQALTARALPDPGHVAELVRLALSDGAFPGPGGCRRWQVHMVVPASTDSLHDLALHELFTRLIDQCGGVLATWTNRWIAPGGEPLVLPQIPDGVVSPTVGTLHPVYRIPNTLFAVDSSSITTSGQAAFVRVATDILTRYSGRAFTCTGSADGTGGSSPAVLAVDRELSVARASEVCRYRPGAFSWAGPLCRLWSNDGRSRSCPAVRRHHDR